MIYIDVVTTPAMNEYKSKMDKGSSWLCIYRLIVVSSKLYVDITTEIIISIDVNIRKNSLPISTF